MRMFEELVPLGPALDNISFGIHYHQAMLPAPVDSISAFPIVGFIRRAKRARCRALAGISKRFAAYREGKTGPELG
jgi:hypothetical protein